MDDEEASASGMSPPDEGKGRGGSLDDPMPESVPRKTSSVTTLRRAGGATEIRARQRARLNGLVIPRAGRRQGAAPGAAVTLSATIWQSAATPRRGTVTSLSRNSRASV